MSGDAYNPNDPAFLLSRGLDGDLSAEERRRLEESLLQSESLRSEVAKLEAVNRLLARWRKTSIEVDWKHHAALTSAVARSAGDKQLDKVDELLQRWRNRNAEVEAIDLTPGVLAEIRSQRRGANPYRLVLRLGVPLAAAAAIVLALTVTTWFAPPRDPVCRVAIGPSWKVSVVEREFESRSVVSFVRSSEVVTTMLTPPAIGFATIGVEPHRSVGEDSAPL